MNFYDNINHIEEQAEMIALSRNINRVSQTLMSGYSNHVLNNTCFYNEGVISDVIETVISGVLKLLRFVGNLVKKTLRFISGGKLFGDKEKSNNTSTSPSKNKNKKESKETIDDISKATSNKDLIPSMASFGSDKIEESSRIISGVINRMNKKMVYDKFSATDDDKKKVIDSIISIIGEKGLDELEDKFTNIITSKRMKWMDDSIDDGSLDGIEEVNKEIEKNILDLFNFDVNEIVEGSVSPNEVKGYIENIIEVFYSVMDNTNISGCEYYYQKFKSGSRDELKNTGFDLIENIIKKIYSKDSDFKKYFEKDTLRILYPNDDNIDYDIDITGVNDSLMVLYGWIEDVYEIVNNDSITDKNDEVEDELEDVETFDGNDYNYNELKEFFNTEASNLKDSIFKESFIEFLDFSKDEGENITERYNSTNKDINNILNGFEFRNIIDVELDDILFYGEYDYNDDVSFEDSHIENKMNDFLQSFSLNVLTNYLNVYKDIIENSMDNIQKMEDNLDEKIIEMLTNLSVKGEDVNLFDDIQKICNIISGFNNLFYSIKNIHDHLDISILSHEFKNIDGLRQIMIYRFGFGVIQEYYKNYL